MRQRAVDVVQQSVEGVPDNSHLVVWVGVAGPDSGGDAMIVVGAPNSSNSQRLKEVAERAGCPRAALLQRAADIDWTMFGNIARLGVTAGASAPEVLVEEILDAFAERYTLSVETVSATEEEMFFPLPRPLREPQAAE